MNTRCIKCLPDKTQIKDLLQAGYKIKLDGKILTKKKIDEFFTSVLKVKEE